MVGVFDVQRVTFFPAIAFQSPAESAIKPGIQKDGRQLVLYRNSSESFAENMHQEKAIGAAAESHCNTVAIGYHMIPVDGLADRPVQSLVYPAGMLLQRSRLKSPEQRRALFDLFLLLIFYGNFPRCDLPKGHNDILIFR
jgi:hypothetical protein